MTVRRFESPPAKPSPAPASTRAPAPPADERALADERESRPSRLRWALVLGARVQPDGAPSRMLEDRLRIALELLSAGRVERLLLSGAATPARGDEVHAMRSFCRRQGVAASRLVCDPGGTRTRLSLQRAAELFGVRRVYLCTQRFHLPRARYWAEAYGLDAVAAPADRRPYRRALRDRTRELAAWAKALAERWLLAPPSRLPPSPPDTTL